MTNMELEKTANEVRKSIVTAVHSAKAGHPGGSLSAADIFTYLYFEELNIDPKNPKMQTATVLCFQKATRRRDFMQFWQNVDFSRRRILSHCVIQALTCRDIRI